MGFEVITKNLLREHLFNYRKFRKADLTLDTTPLSKGNDYNHILFDANALYYTVFPFIENMDLPDDEALECLAFLTVAIVIDIYNSMSSKKNVNNNIIGLFYDGAPPMSKLVTQVARRAEDAEKERLKRLFSEDPNLALEALSPKTHSSFGFMKRYVEKTTKLLMCTMKTLEYYNYNVKMFINTSKVPGEGEHKIFEFMDAYDKREKYQKGKYNPKGPNILIVSDDSDVPLIALTRYPSGNMTFLRSVFKDQDNPIDSSLNIKDVEGNFELPKAVKNIKEFCIFYLFKHLNGFNENTLINLDISKFMTFFNDLDVFPILSKKISQLYSVPENTINLNINYQEHDDILGEYNLTTPPIYVTGNLSRLRKALYDSKSHSKDPVNPTGDIKGDTTKKSNTYKSYNMTPELTSHKIALLIILHSYIGTDFSPIRFDINKTVLSKMSLRIVNKFTKITDFDLYLRVRVTKHKSREYSFYDISHYNIFRLLYNSLSSKSNFKNQHFKRFKRFSKSGKEFDANDPDRDLMSFTGMSGEDVIRDYITCINYTLEYFSLGIDGGSKKYYTRLPYAPSFKMMKLYLTKNTDIFPSFSILNNEFSSNGYLDDAFMHKMFSIVPNFVYDKDSRGDNKYRIVPVLNSLYNHIEVQLKKHKVVRPLKKIRQISNSSITILNGNHFSHYVSLRMRNCVNIEFENSDIITNILLKKYYKSRLNLQSLISMYQIDASIRDSPVFSFTGIDRKPISDDVPDYLQVALV